MKNKVFIIAIVFTFIFICIGATILLITIKLVLEHSDVSLDSLYIALTVLFILLMLILNQLIKKYKK